MTYYYNDTQSKMRFYFIWPIQQDASDIRSISKKYCTVRYRAVLFVFICFGAVDVKTDTLRLQSWQCIIHLAVG